MGNEQFLVDGRQISADECLRIFSSPKLEDRQNICLQWLEGKTILDIGCYSGAFGDLAMRAVPGRQVIGLDYDPENLHIARFLFPQHAFVRSSVYAIGIGDESLDCVAFQEVIEHLEGAALAVKEINRILKPGGILILSTPQPYYWRDMAAFLVREFLGLFARRKTLKPSIFFKEVEWNRHIYCWTPSTLLTLLVTNGFEYVTHGYGRDGRNRLESIFLRIFPFLGPTQILKVRKTGTSKQKLI